jgi:transitional endoplasmic reticulum ATPase
MNVTIRHYNAQDLGRVLRLWEERGPVSAGDGLTVDQAVDLINAENSVTLVAEDAGELIGVAVGEKAAVVGWVHKVSVAPDSADGADVAHQLLSEIESRLTDRGARTLATLVAQDDASRQELERRGYQPVPEKVYVERDVPAAGAMSAAVAEIGGQMVPEGLWERLAGMDEAKQIIERRVVLPLAQPELASRHAVDTPRAIMLFGPPGTGKTTFAKGLASRLGWVFVEIQPGELASEGRDRQAQRLAEMFNRVLVLPNAVVFVDEVEDIASTRQGERKVGPSVTNEFLKQIPRLRESVNHLLICATNAVDRKSVV